MYNESLNILFNDFISLYDWLWSKSKFAFVHEPEH